MAERLSDARLAEIRELAIQSTRRPAAHRRGVALRDVLAHIDAQQAKIDRLKALLGEAESALLAAQRESSCTDPECAFEDCRLVQAVLAKLAEEGL